MNTDMELDAILQSLREAFLLEAPALITEVLVSADSALSSYDSNQENADLKPLLMASHKLAGSAAQFECPKLSQLSKIIELCTQALMEVSPESEQIRRDLDSAISELRKMDFEAIE